MNGISNRDSILFPLKLLRTHPKLAVGVIALSITVSILTSGTVSASAKNKLEKHLLTKYERSVYGNYNRNNSDITRVKMNTMQHELLENLSVEINNIGRSSPFWQAISPKKVIYNFDYKVTSNGEVVYEQENVYKLVKRGAFTVRDSSAAIFYLNFFI